MVTCLVIDNDKKTVDSLKSTWDDAGKFSFIQTNEIVEESLNLILKLQPEIVIFNLESKSINVSEFLLEISLCEIEKPFFIALSTLKVNAFNAYEYGFDQFMLKPLTELSIRKTLLRYQKKYPIKKNDTICLKSYKDYQYLIIEDILYLKADNNTTDFYMSDGRIISAYKTLKIFENLLPKTFLRIHKSYMINKDAVSRIHYGKSICVINNEHKIPFTKTFKENIDSINTFLSRNTHIALN